MATVLVTETDWLLPAHAALQLGVHVDTVRRWADNGRLEAIRTVQGRMVSAESVAKVVAEREAALAS